MTPRRAARMGTSRALAAILPIAGLLVLPTHAQRTGELPPELQAVSITQKINAQIPLESEFVDEDGRAVPLSRYFSGRPVILTLNYYRCPMLCGLQLNGLVDALKRIEWMPGKQFEIITISFDPLETPRLAKAKKQNYVNEYGRAGAAAGWHFLTGKKDSIKRLTETVGFAYRWNEETQQWAHSAALIICTPEGRVSRYIGGVMYDPTTVRLSLVEASEGEIGSLWDQAFLWCYHYDATEGRYNLMAAGIMRFGGGLTLLVLAVVLAGLWRREARRRKSLTAGAPM